MAKSSGGSRGGRGGGSTSSYTTESGQTYTAGVGGVTQADVDAIRELDGANTNVRASAGIAPTGRAPRGQGQAYADRRAIASRIDTIQNRIQSLQSSVANTKSTRRTRFNLGRNQATLSELRRTLPVTVAIANGPGDWSAKRSLINDLLNSIQGL